MCSGDLSTGGASEKVLENIRGCSRGWGGTVDQQMCQALSVMSERVHVFSL